MTQSSRMSQLESLANNYIVCWRKTRPVYDNSVYEDNDFGCENYQIFQNGFDIGTFTHDEISNLPWLLTRELRGQINRDHKIFWAWCGNLVNYPLFSKDMDWVNAFVNLINLLLSSQRYSFDGPERSQFIEKTLNYVNWHLLQMDVGRHIIAAPLSFAVLEGLLRRKNYNYLDKNGKVKKNFQIQINNKPYHPGKTVNQISVSLRLFEQCTVKDRKRLCDGLDNMNTEILSLYPAEKDVYELISSWRNDFMHGGDYWKRTTAIIVNLICLLVIDEIDPQLYDAKLEEIGHHIEWREKTQSFADRGNSKELYPPDLDK